MTIIISGTVDLDPERIEASLAHARPLIEGALGEDGCLDYDWCPDPRTPGRVRVFERWRDEPSLRAHFAGRWYHDMRAALAGYGIRGAKVAKYRIDIEEPVYDGAGNVRADFFTARPDPVADEAAIRALVSRYADAVCRRDQAAWAANWAADGVWALPGSPVMRGRDAIVALWAGAMSRFPFVAQTILNGLVDVEGDIAHGRWYLTEHITFGNGSGMFNIGVYHDRYVREAGGWRFAERHYSVLYNDKGKGDMSGDAPGFPAVTPFAVRGV